MLQVWKENRQEELCIHHGEEKCLPPLFCGNGEEAWRIESIEETREALSLAAGRPI